MKHVARFAVAVLLAAVTSIANAACSGEAQGQSGGYGVSISDHGCTYSEVMIQVYELNEFHARGDKPVQLEPFTKECQAAPVGWDGGFTDDVKNGFTCRKDGKTVLSGTTYKPTKDTNPTCGGDIGVRLTCVHGCNKKAPKYLYLEPYEC